MFMGKFQDETVRSNVGQLLYEKKMLPIQLKCPDDDNHDMKTNLFVGSEVAWW